MSRVRATLLSALVAGVSFGGAFASTPLSPDAADVPVPVHISSSKLEVFAKEHRAVYWGNARVVRAATVMTCDELVVHYDTERNITRIEAKGNVEVNDEVNGTARWARGEHADFDNRTGVLVITGDPEARQGDTHVKGSKVTFTVGEDLARVEDARTVVANSVANGPANNAADAGTSLAAKPPVLIRARVLDIDAQNRRAIWAGKVFAERGTLDLQADRMIATYSPSQELEQLVATGNVEATDEDRWAAGERAVFEQKRGVLVVTGNPRARQGPHTMTGTRVVFTAGKDTLEVENAQTVVETQGADSRRRWRK